MEIYLGKTSDNEPVLRNVRELPVVFLVYNHKKQWDDYLERLIVMNAQAKHSEDWELFRIISRYRVINMSGTIAFNHLAELEKYVNIKIKNAGKKEKGSSNMVLLIDDIFQLKLFDNKKAARFLLKLLERGEQLQIYLLIGTVGLFRGLLNELMNFSAITQATDINNRFSELVINDDDLIFFRERGAGSFSRYF